MLDEQFNMDKCGFMSPHLRFEWLWEAIYSQTKNQSGVFIVPPHLFDLLEMYLEGFVCIPEEYHCRVGKLANGCWLDDGYSKTFTEIDSNINEIIFLGDVSYCFQILNW